MEWKKFSWQGLGFEFELESSRSSRVVKHSSKQSSNHSSSLEEWSVSMEWEKLRKRTKRSSPLSTGESQWAISFCWVRSRMRSIIIDF